MRACRQLLGVVTALLVLSACDSREQAVVEADRSSPEQPPALSTDQLPVPVAPVKEQGETPAVLRIGSTINLEGSNQEAQVRLWLEHVFTELGYDMQLEFVPGRRMIIELNRGIMDVDLVRTVDISRGFDNILRVEYPWINSCILAIGLRGQQQAYADATAQGKEQTVGVITGSPGFLSLIARQWPAAKITEYKSDRQAALMLQHQRVDFVVAPHVNWGGLRKASARPLDVYDVVTEMQGYMHIHKSHAELIPDLIASMKKNAAESAAFSCTTERFRAQLKR
ncbi:hypothetical protein R50073_45250 [Maricurvus nonylphenolicus]|uniref:hypothetical protein n=1 Tax=Maricurvus nonylphenolicus TaxID=1008307 RepID=UPI0036F29FE8